jgi:hypothetical protein
LLVYHLYAFNNGAVERSRGLALPTPRPYSKPQPPPSTHPHTPQITNDYQPGVIHRPDTSLHIYGFVAPADPPLLPATDLPTFNNAAPWAVSAPTDDGFHGPNGTHLTEAERARLRALIDAAPTTLAEDAALLAGGELDGDAKMRTVVEFRVARKRALARALGRVEAALARGAAGGGDKDL